MKSINIEVFLKEREVIPVIDVRSPAEFKKGHIPGAINVPLFSDEERAIVGTKYVQESRYSSVVAGLDMVGPKLSSFVETATKIATDGKILVYCWRGGMRSSSMAWLLNLSGIQARTIVGGYKSYRRFGKEFFSKPFKIIVLGGMTGSGKTDILKQLLCRGEQVLDLEGLANHKGSAFGAIGQKPQPSTEFFENLLFEEIYKLDASKHFWVEDESKSIGSVFIPHEFFDQMLNSRVIAIERTFESRVKKLTAEYTSCDPQLLIDSTRRIAKRLGGDNVTKAIQCIEEGQFDEAVAISLKYYDKAYQYGLTNKKVKPIVCKFESEDLVANCDLLLETFRRKL